MSSTQFAISVPCEKLPVRKIILLGDERVGKSSIFHRFISDRFDPIYTSSIGIDFQAKTHKFEGQQTNLRIWDSSGQRRFNTITAPFIEACHVIVVVYDRTDIESFYNIPTWLRMVETNSQDPKIVLVGNKSDLKDQIQVSTEIGRNYALECGMHYIETSAFENTGIEDIFNGYYFSIEIKEPEE
jgi:small GTP-binding protein